MHSRSDSPPSSPLKLTSTSTMTSTANAVSSQAIASNNDNKKDVLSSRGKASSGKSSSSGRNQHFRGAQQHQQNVASPSTRPQPRGHHYPKRPKASSSRALSTMTEADEYEVGSVFNAGCKKQNMNHLLNFQFEPRGNKKEKRGGGGFHNKANYQAYVPKKKYKKEQYLQANCQFVVKSAGDYTIHLTDPDTVVDWDQVEQVCLKTSGVPSCPICLYPPNAAKIARCGHVFCWPCILHYLALSDDDYRKCPICYDTIHKDDLKSVVSLLHSEVQTGSDIELQLMRRERNSLFAVPVSAYHPDINKKHPNLSATLTSYSNLLIATPMEVLQNILDRERKDLEAQYRNEQDQPESIFIKQALQQLEIREQEIMVLSSAPTLDPLPPFSPKEDVLTPSHSPETEELGAVERPRHESSSSDGLSSGDNEEVVEEAVVTADDLDISGIGSSRPLPKDTFYFYQSSDGQPIFLHALNVQMMIQEYGSWENCPSTIKGKILEKDHTSMNEEMRNKLRYLRHLPLTCNFEVCEIQMNEEIVSQETFAKFKVQLDERRRKRAKRDRDEKRRDKRINMENDKLLGKFPDPKLRIESEFHFPEVNRASFSSMTSLSPSLRRSSESVNSTLSTSPPESSAQGVSFAKMLREGVAKPSAHNAWLMKKSETFPSLTADPDSEPEPEGYVRPPPQSSIGDALALAMERASLANKEGKSGKKKGKKNKGTKIILGGAARPEL